MQGASPVSPGLASVQQDSRGLPEGRKLPDMLGKCVAGHVSRETAESGAASPMAPAAKHCAWASALLQAATRAGEAPRVDNRPKGARGGGGHARQRAHAVPLQDGVLAAGPPAQPCAPASPPPSERTERECKTPFWHSRKGEPPL